MENDLIRRKDAEDVVMNHCGCCGKAIQQIPEVDAVEVVRCKNCKHWHLEDELPHITAFFECTHSGPYKGHYTDKDFFCAYGEKSGTETM